jgi:parallel beta-helix repeat protein
MAVLAEDSDDLAFTNVHVRVRPHTRRLMSSTADGIHGMNCGGQVEIEDCSFEGLGDDAVNVHGMYLVVDRIVNATSVLAHHPRNYTNLPRAGDTVEFSPSTTMLPYANRTVTSVKLNVEPGLHGINFSAPLPDSLAVGDILGNATRAPVTHLLRNRVLTNRGRGFLASSRNVEIADNLFEFCTAGSLLLAPSIVSFFESIGVAQVTLRNNTSEHCNYGTGSCEADMQVCLYLGDWSQAAAGANHDVTIEGNTIENTGNTGFYIGAASNITLLNNVLRGCCDHPNRGEGTAGIWLRNTSGVRLEGNQLLAPSAAMTSALAQQNATQTTQVNNIGF